MKAKEFYFVAPNRDGVYEKLEKKLIKLGKINVVSVQLLEMTSKMDTPNSFQYTGHYMVIWR